MAKILDDPVMMWLLGGILGLLIVASAATAVLRMLVHSDGGRATMANVGTRVRAWWVMTGVLAVAMLLGPIVSISLFGIMSFLALREFITITPTQRGDHRALFWAFFIIVPLQYLFVGIHWTGMFLVFIPVYCFLFLPIRSVATDDPQDFLGRTSKIHWGLMVCVFALSHVPALLTLEIPGQPPTASFRLLIFLAVCNQGCDVLQFIWGKTCGRHAVLPHISPKKTWEGLTGGVLSVGGLGAALWWATPFVWWQAGLFGLGIGMLGFFGDVVLSAIKRDAGIKDYGHLIAGHGGILDRVDSMCFAAPVFFHLVRYLYVP
ncbi:MAG: phosphatidate cytidylyltransferase [Planctomycetota bacterium]